MSSGREYNYDEEGVFFPYFIFTLTALITLPLSYSLLKPTDAIENAAPRIKSDYRAPQHDLIDQQKKKQWRQERRLKRILTVGLGYLTMAVMLYLISVTEAERPTIWNPYDILSIGTSSSESQIKKRFRDLSRTLHPDKAVPDATKNETLEVINDRWVEISKAFKALTDEDVRANYEKYGNPDGRQSFSIGIALPQMIVKEGSGKYVLLVYGALLGVLLPWLVGKWWYGTQKLTKEKVLRPSAANFFQDYEEDMEGGAVINALSGGLEYVDVLGAKAEVGINKIERSILRDDNEADTTVTAGPSAKDQTKWQSFDGARRKTAALLWSYLGRRELDGSVLDEEKYEVASIGQRLLDSVLAVTLAYGNTAPLLSTYEASQGLIQAIPPNGSPLLQLPHVTPAIARAIEAPLTKTHLSIQELMDMPEYKRRKLCTDQPAPIPQLSPAQYNTAVSTARRLPFLRIEKAFFKVVGEKYVTPGSLVSFVVKSRVIPPGTQNIPEVDPKDLEDIDPDEGDLDAILGRRQGGRTKGAQMQDTSTKDAEIVPPLAHAPYFPRDHSPRYHIFLADPKAGKIAVPPFTMTTFDKPLFNEDGTPTFNVQTFKMQFQSPAQEGSYSFVMHVVCDSYLGSDSVQPIKLNVESAEKAEEMSSEEDISEPEEDSLAGQMRAMQGGGAAPPKQKRKRVVVEESSDDESGTDEEQSDDSATDTETEDES